ncbi:MAG TPA: guanylate kinase [Myxococcota bacterium]|nr:guanylate kinase [Myxococcota bacterium]
MTSRAGTPLVARAGFPLVVAAPSGTGKTTVCRALVARDPQLVFSVSHTTRRQRPGEQDGRDYHFVPETEFRRMKDAGAFLEWAVYNDHLYGTSFAAIDAALADGRDVVLEIEVQGARQVRERRADARLVFLLPPSWQALEARLRGRGTDGDEEITRRLRVAEGELAAACDFDYAVVNDEVESCVRELAGIVAAERRGDVASLRARFAPGPALERISVPRIARAGGRG